jgi:hypothetical protein
MTNFLNKAEANEFYANKSPLAEHILKLPVINTAKVFPGKRYVLFEKKGEDIAVHACLRANVVSMDKDGLFVLLKDYDTDKHIKVEYIPVPIVAKDGRAVFLSIPSHCNLERTLRRRNGKVQESVAMGILVRQEASPDEVPLPEDTLFFVGYEEFQKLTKRIISKMEF